MILIILICGCISPQLPGVAVPYDQVTDQIVATFTPMTQSVQTAHDDLSIDCVYRNVSSGPVEINTLILNASSWILRLTDPNGHILPTVPITFYSREQLQKYVSVLKPGEDYRVHYEGILHSYMTDMPAGQYEIDVIGIQSEPAKFTLVNSWKY